MRGERTGSPSPPRSGIPYCIVLFLLFWWASATFVQRASGISALARDCALRALFGAAGLYLFVKDFQKGSWAGVIHLRHFKEGMLPGAGLFLMMLFQLLVLAAALVGGKSNADAGITALHLFLYLFLQQLTTGFWEEMVFRGFLLEGYFSSENRTWKTRLGYAFLSFALFGLGHTIGCGSLPLALSRFLTTGAIGFVFAAMYLYSHNLLSCMLLHFIYDVFAHAASSGSAWYCLAIAALTALAFIIAIVYVIKEPVDERMMEQ